RAVGLAAADEDRSAAVAVTSRAAALLAAVFLAGARDVTALAGGARRSAAVDQLPGDDSVEDVGARLDGENLVVELDVAAALAGRARVTKCLYLDLHLSLPCSHRLRASPRRPELQLLASRPQLRLRLRWRRRLPARRRSRRLPRRSEARASRGPRPRRRGRQEHALAPRPALPFR